MNFWIGLAAALLAIGALGRYMGTPLLMVFVICLAIAICVIAAKYVFFSRQDVGDEQITE